MRKILYILLLALMPSIAGAQDYKPLEPVEVPDFPSNVIRVTVGSSPDYNIAHMMGARGMNVQLGVPAEFEMYLRIQETPIPQGITAKLIIGGEEYWMATNFCYNNSVYINIHGEHIRHMAVSGLQSIIFMKNGDTLHSQEFNPIEQELWRGTAEELVNTVEKFNIL